MDTINIGDINNAKLSTIKLHKATIHDSELRNVEVYNCTIYDSTFVKSKMFDCNIFKSKFKLCELYGVKLVKCDFDDVIITPAPPSLSKLPIEVREMIFELALSNFPCAAYRAHPFLAALRGSTELYMQAVDIFNKFNIFKVTAHNISRFIIVDEDPYLERLHKNVMQGIKRMSIECDDVHIDDFRPGFCDLSTLIELHIDMSWSIRDDGFTDPFEDHIEFRTWIDKAINAFKSLKKLSVSTAGIPMILNTDFSSSPELYGTPQEPKWVDAIQLVSNQLGINVQVIGKLDVMSRDNGLPLGIRDYGEIVWLWEAKRGETLKGRNE